MLGPTDMKNICTLWLFASLVIFRVNPVASPWNRMKPQRRHVVLFSQMGGPAPVSLGMKTWTWAILGNRPQHHTLSSSQAHLRDLCTKAALLTSGPPACTLRAPCTPGVWRKESVKQSSTEPSSPGRWECLAGVFLEQAAIRGDLLSCPPLPKTEINQCYHSPS